MAQMRNRRRLARRLASAFEIFSPAYSAIFFPRLKATTEKHPWPSIEDFLIVNPGASVSLMLAIVTQAALAWLNAYIFYYRNAVTSSSPGVAVAATLGKKSDEFLPQSGCDGFFKAR
jgi:hypothetical protein